MPPAVAPTFGVAISNLKLVFTPQMLFVVFTFLFMDFFDTAGTILAVGSKVGLLKSDGSIENGSKALLADSAATCIWAILGITNTTSCKDYKFFRFNFDSNYKIGICTKNIDVKNAIEYIDSQKVIRYFIS